MTLTKAGLYDVDNKIFIECHFNPNEVSISKSNKWDADKSAGTNLPDVVFKGEGARALTLTLIFDTYEKRSDVRKLTDRVLALMDAPADKSKGTKGARPPHVIFQWGEFHTFPSVITQLSQKFTLFLESGLPVRATLGVTLQEVPQQTAKHQAKGQNPTSLAVGAERVHVVQPGDTIDLIASDEMGESSDWRRLAEANNLDDPRRLKPGLRLMIPAEV